MVLVPNSDPVSISEQELCSEGVQAPSCSAGQAGGHRKRTQNGHMQHPSGAASGL